MTVMKESDVKTATMNPAGSPFDMAKTEAPQAFRELGEKGAAQAKETYEKMSAATAEVSNLIQNSCSTAARGAMEYNVRVIEIARTNANAAFDYANELLGAKSPSEFVEIATEHAREHFDTLAEQTRQLSALGQKVALEIAEPLQAGVTKAFQRHTS
jgi:phasin